MNALDLIALTDLSYSRMTAGSFPALMLIASDALYGPTATNRAAHAFDRAWWTLR